jgi:tetraacyldisaccharide 4'-kinase
MPLSALYGLVTEIRNYLFDRNFFKSVKFPISVISIGNIAAGGTGKTPHTEFILNVLNKSYKCAVLSRGYKRITTGFLEVNERCNFTEVGDEPLQIARKFSNVNVAVAEKRAYGIKKILEKNPETNVVILDDAFQHRQVKPSLSILLTSYGKLFTTDYLLPAGFLRERRKNYKRADIIIVTKCPVNIGKDEINAIRMKINPFQNQRIFFSGYEYSDLIPVFNAGNNKKIDFNDLKNRKYTGLILTGIASTKEFWDKTRKLCDDTVTLSFPDHHDFTRNDIRKIEQKFRNIKNDAKIIITTEKDAIRLVDNKFLSQEIKQYIFYIQIFVKILDNNEDLFIKTITDHVGKNKRNS